MTERRIWVPREAINAQYVTELRKLRLKALATQRDEGGALSAASLTEFQLQLDKINRSYKRRLRDIN